MKKISDLKIREIKAYVTETPKQKHPIEELAEQFGLSANSLRHRFLEVEGVTLGAYVRQVRMESSAQAVLDGRSVAEIAAEYQFGRSCNFSHVFKDYFGISPQQYKVEHGLPPYADDRKLRGVAGQVTKRVVDYLRAHPDEDLTPLEAAKRLGISEARFRRSVLDEAGVSWAKLTRYGKEQGLPEK